MIHLKSYQPTHEQMARIEHGIAVNRRRYFALKEAGNLDLAEQVRLELDYLNLSYWKYHSPQAEPCSLRDATSSTVDTLEDK